MSRLHYEIVRGLLDHGICPSNTELAAMRALPAIHGWWAPCIWCAFGVAALAGGEIAIHLPRRFPPGARRRQSQGERMPLRQLRLVQIWYGQHARPDWKQWTIAEAREIFSRVGRRSSFWDLGARTGSFRPAATIVRQWVRPES